MDSGRTVSAAGIPLFSGLWNNVKNREKQGKIGRKRLDFAETDRYNRIVL
jgi:hypothetical protein